MEQPHTACGLTPGVAGSGTFVPFCVPWEIETVCRFRSKTGLFQACHTPCAGQGKARCCRSVNTGFFTTPIDANFQNEIDSQN